jgi:hypothetical protein
VRKIDWVNCDFVRKEKYMTQYDDDEAFENGVLRDGARHRVGLHMSLRAPMITDGTDDPLGLHRPGWRIASGGITWMVESNLAVSTAGDVAPPSPRSEPGCARAWP